MELPSPGEALESSTSQKKRVVQLAGYQWGVGVGVLQNSRMCLEMVEAKMILCILTHQSLLFLLLFLINIPQMH